MKDSPNIRKAVKKSLDFETTLADIRRKSEKRAWTVAGISTFVSLCLAAGLFYVLPLKEKVPYLIMADAYTGQAAVAKLTGEWQANSITKQEAVNKSNVARFVIARESFDNRLIYDHDWTTVYAMSVPEVSGSYRSLMNKDRPDSPFNVYGTARALRVKILSIVLNRSESGRDAGASVRFQRFVLNKNTGVSQYLDSHVATLTYQYRDNMKTDEKYRLVNPLGFQVSAYRVDPDSTAAALREESPPATVEAESPAAEGGGR